MKGPMASKNHFVRKVQRSRNQFIIDCYTLAENFEHIREICAAGYSLLSLDFNRIEKNKNVVFYQVILPANIDSEISFFILQHDEKQKRVWRPSAELDTSSLPEGFYFTNRYLNLAYSNDIDHIHSYKERFSTTIDPVLTGLQYKNNILNIRGIVFIPQSFPKNVDDAELRVIKFRNEDVFKSFRITTSPLEGDALLFNGVEKRVHGEIWQKDILLFECAIDHDQLKHFSGYFNLYVKYNNNLVTLKNYHKKLERKDHRYLARISLFRRSVLVPYIDDVANVWRLDIYNMSRFEWSRMLTLLKKVKEQQITKDPKVWLIGEYGETARDNGLHFFNYMRKTHPQCKVYYVVAKDSSDRKNITDSNVVFYGSYKHFKIAAQAKVLIFTHYPNYLIPKINAITEYRGKYQAYHTIFIQHGVIATTASVLRYRKKSRYYDRFIVSSSFEKANICKYLGYDKDEVVVTGLARWDRLLTISEKSRDILIMPTWRNDLANASIEEFRSSGFYKFWDSLLKDEEFLCFIEENNIRVKFFLHIGIERFYQCFDFPSKIDIATGENLQSLIATCGILVTDYSSVAFDILIQNKPVIFCPFDIDEMQKLRPGPQFIDFNTDLPGPICLTVAETVDEIRKSVMSNNALSRKAKERSSKYFDYIDKQNCDRIYNTVRLLIQE